MFIAEEYTTALNQKVDKYTRQNKSAGIIFAKLILWNIRYFLKTSFTHSSFKDSLTHVVFEVRGGAGDIVLSAKYIKAFAEHFGENIKIDILCEPNFYDITKLVCSSLPIENIITKSSKTYDLYINLVRFPVVKYFFDTRLKQDLLQYINHINNFHQNNPLVAKNDFYGRCYAKMQGRNRENQADIDGLLSLEKIKWQLASPQNSAEILQKFGLSENKYITLHTGYGQHFIGVEKETRQWPEEYYTELARMIKEKYPEYQIVQIGELRQTKITGADIDLRSKTSLEELLAIIKQASLHISQEGGLAIMRHAMHAGKSVVLFGPTDEHFYGFEENVNLTARTCQYPCEWITKDWMKKCIKTNTEAHCMPFLTPEIVMKEIITTGSL